MNNLSRRLLLRALPLSAAALALPAAAEAMAPQTPRERLVAAIEAVKAAAAEIYPGITDWSVAIGSPGGCPVLVAAYQPPAPVMWDGPGIYEFALLNEPCGNGFVQPVAFLDDSRRRAGWYRWQHYYRGKFQGRGRNVPASRLKIIRKVEALG